MSNKGREKGGVRMSISADDRVGGESPFKIVWTEKEALAVGEEVAKWLQATSVLEGQGGDRR